MGWGFQHKPLMGWPLDHDSGLVPDAGFWPMLEGSGNRVFDLTGNSNTGVFAAADSPRWQGDYVNFDTGVERIVVPHNDTIDFTSEAFSVTVIFRTSSAAQQYIVNKNYGGAGVKWWALIVSATSRASFGLDDGESSLWTSSTNAINDGKWHIITGVRTVGIPFGQREIWTDGQRNTLLHTGGAVNNTGDLFIGCRADLSATRDFIGDIKCVYIHNRALIHDEVRSLHRKPFCMFKDPAEIALLGGYIIPVVGAGIMTTNTGYWGPTF